jgi:hypothetical protein
MLNYPREKNFPQMYRKTSVILGSVTLFKTTLSYFVILKIVGKQKRPKMATQKSALFATRKNIAREDTKIL